MKFCPSCGMEVEYVTQVVGFTSAEVFCRHCDKKALVSPPQPVPAREWESIDRSLMQWALRSIPTVDAKPTNRRNPRRPVLEALRRNGNV